MPPGTHLTAVVTGASSGIGAATARAWPRPGFHVVCAARRSDRVEALAAEIGGTPVTCDVTDADSVAALAARSAPGSTYWSTTRAAPSAPSPVGRGRHRGVAAMYEVNVIGAGARSPRRCCPRCVASGAGVIVNVGSTAGRVAYEGGGGYTAAKHGTRSSPRRCGSSCAASRCGSARSRRAWCAPTSSRWSVRRRPGEGRRPSTPASPSRWSPRTSPTRSPGSSPGPPRQHRRAGDPAPRPGRPAQGAPRHRVTRARSVQTAAVQTIGLSAG